MMRSVVVAGASLAGLRAAETLRQEGFDGTITMVGAEPRLPYDRPPLSKQVLAGEWPPEQAALPAGQPGGDLELDWRLGTTATALDLARRSVRLDDGSELGFDGVVVATGATPRRLAGMADLDGVHTLRTLDDCLAIRSALDAGPGRVVVVGAGFIGAEVAATCRKRGLAVTLVEALPVPLSHAVGPAVGEVFADLHRDHGVDVRLSMGVAGFEGAERVERVLLADDSTVVADVVVVGVGVTPATAWLEGSGLTLADGVVCDETCLAAPGVVAAGDVARWPNPRFGEVMRVEHWENAVTQGAAAARRLLAGDGGGEPFAPIPWFWSDQYDRKLQLAGRAGPGTDVAVVEGSLEDRRFVALFGRAGRLVGVLGMNRPPAVMRYRQLIADGASWEAALAMGERAS